MSEYVDEHHEAAVDEILDAAAFHEQCAQIGATVLRQTHAYGKLILLGEHFVVYHVPALVGAVSDYTDCHVQLIPVVGDASSAANEQQQQPQQKPGLEIIDHRPAVPLYKVQKADEGKEAVALVLKHMSVDFERQYKVRCTFGGTLTCVSGIGASAAQVVSLARALSYALRRAMTEDEINMAGYEGEKGYHGTPSGIDNTAATFGGLLQYQRDANGGAPVFHKFALSEPIRIVYASTGITASTTKVVNDVRDKRESDPAWFDALLQQYITLVGSAETALLQSDMKALGDCMNQNHALLQELTVSCPELDDLVDAARHAGAIGAKMSGTGRGGLMMALTPTVELQQTVAAALTAAGAPQVWQTTLA